MALREAWKRCFNKTAGVPNFNKKGRRYRKYPSIFPRRNIIVITDEAHHSQYGLKATDIKANRQNPGRYVFSAALVCSLTEHQVKAFR